MSDGKMTANWQDHIIKHPSPNFGPRPDGCPIDILVLHYTGMTSGKAALDRLCDPESYVSCHYMVEEDGRIFQMVEEDKRAWHAGRGKWQDCSDVNSHSIGIEIVNPGHEFGYRPFPEVQIASVIALAGDIVARHAIPASRVIAHSDMAPDRKEDPGELFPWDQLVANGIGLWPKEPVSPTTSRADIEQFDRLLDQIGFGEDPDVDPIKRVIAFQRHWRASDISGVVDAECIAIAKALVDQMDI